MQGHNHGSGTLNNLIMIKLQVLFTKGVQDVPLIHVMEPVIGSDTDCDPS